VLAESPGFSHGEDVKISKTTGEGIAVSLCYLGFIIAALLTRSQALHRIEAEKRQRYGWWLKSFLPAEVRPGNRDERYRLGILVL
jgi:hypothetical protein